MYYELYNYYDDNRERVMFNRNQTNSLTCVALVMKLWHFVYFDTGVSIDIGRRYLVTTVFHFKICVRSLAVVAWKETI